jgi:hypothetical protein
MYPKQAVDIVQGLLDQHTKEPSQTRLGLLSLKQVQAITFLADFVDEVRQAKDLVRVIDRLFDEGIIYAEEAERPKRRKAGRRR